MSFKNVIELSTQKTLGSDANRKDEESSAVLSPEGGTPHPETGLRYNGFFALRCVFFSPEVLKTLTPGEAVLFLYLNFLAWRYPTKEGYVRAANT